MILFTDNEGKIKDVGSTKDSSLIRKEVSDEDNPFLNWSIAKVCCYRIETVNIPIYLDSNGEDQEPIGVKTVITMYTPYVDSRIIEHIDQLGKEVDAITPYTETKTAYIGDTEVVFFPPNIGNVTVYFDKPYTMEKLSDRIIISFDELEEVTEITISII